MEAKRVEVGQTENHLIAYVFDANAKDVTHNYSISCISGDLIVISNAITVQSGNAEKIYDGVALTLEDAKLTAGALMEGHELSVIHTGTLTDAGKVPNTFAVEIHDAIPLLWKFTMQRATILRKITRSLPFSAN